MKRVIKNIICHCLVLLLAVQTLNLSINSVVFYCSSQAATNVDDLDYIDSMIEFIVENVMGFSKNTFHDKANGNNLSKFQQNIVHWDLKWFHYAMAISDLNESQHEIVNIIAQNEKAVILCCQEVRPKPPQLLSI